ncbi:FAD-dependent monooxygenase [Corallococcus silvisoli]|uniref:FAD-dependent monooxygenase n=1 Tax=Corallococcus silvisoli TaxID=2697031 RepID=UPI001F27CFA3|nr:FAD-dependent monooxygenase [Corallococcus silvisoli]
MSRRTVLVTGASVAGPTLAYWLRRYGMDVVVVERAPELRTGGQTVDVRGAGRTVAQRMGLEDAIRACSTNEEGIAFVDANNRTRAAFDAKAFGGEGLIAELEILRGELARLLVERTRDDAEYIFGDCVTGLEDDGERVRVTFQRGAPRTFDLVIAAEGIGSRTRKLVFGDEVTFRAFDLHTAYFTIPRAPSDGQQARWFNAPGSRNVTLRPDNLGTTRALLSFQEPPQGYERLEPARQKALLKRTFAGLGWETPRVLAALDDSPDFYFEAIGQVKMPRWSKGRVALVGDAAYCASPSAAWARASRSSAPTSSPES